LYQSNIASSPGPGTFSFFAVKFNDARIARVVINTGRQSLTSGIDPRPDHVVMDDFIYGEPKAVQ
jgi:hypothetical protein